MARLMGTAPPPPMAWMTRATTIWSSGSSRPFSHSDSPDKATSVVPMPNTTSEAQ